MFRSKAVRSQNNARFKRIHTSRVRNDFSRNHLSNHCYIGIRLGSTVRKLGKSMQNIKIETSRNYGDMALCNLASINLVEWRKSTEERRDQIAKNIVFGLDMAISNGICPIEEGTLSNHLYRYIGVGVMNAANALALDGITIDTPEAAEWFDEVTDDVSYRCIKASMELAKEFGAFPEFESTKWAEGLTPVHLNRQYFPNAWEITEYGKNFESSGRLAKWDQLGQDIKKYGIRHAQVMSIAPTANSGKAINATESTEPVMGLMYKEEGMFNVTSLAPNIKQNLPFYKPAFECDQKALITNAIVRQKYLCQAQSITLYLKKANSLKEMTELHNYGFANGIKTYYYLKQQKQIEVDDDCVACAV